MSEDGKARISARELALEARATVKDMTDFEPETVSALQWDGETWLVSVEVCEFTRIPNTTDVMATYVVQLDDGGGLLKLPLSPVLGTVWIAEQIQAQAEAEYYDEGAIQAQLREVDAARRAGTMDDAEADAAEDALIERLLEGRAR